MQRRAWERNGLLTVWRLLLTFVLAINISMAWAQVATTNADVVRKAITGVPLWHVDRSNGTSLWHFEMRGGTLWVKSINNDGKSIPDAEVKVLNDGLTWVALSGQKITLHYDPQDIQYPFKGVDTEGRTYEFTPK